MERTQEQRNGTTPGSWQSSFSFSVVTSWSGHRSNGTESLLGPFLLQLPVVTSWSGHRSNGTEPLLGPGSPHSPPSASRCPLLDTGATERESLLGADTGATERNHSWVLAVLTLLLQPLSRLPLSVLLQLPVLERTQEQRNGTTPGSWQSSFSFPLSCLWLTQEQRNHSWVLAVLTLLLQLPVAWSVLTQEQRTGTTPPSSFSPLSRGGHRSNGPEPLPGPGSPHSPPSASRCHVLERTQEQRNGTTPGSWQSSLSFSSRCHVLERTQEQAERNHSRSSFSTVVLERTQEQRNGTTPGSWQSSLSSFSFPLSRLGADTGATERNHSWILAVLTLLLQLPVVTSWSGHRSNGTEPLLGPGSPPSASRCHVLEWTQEQRNGTTPGSWQSSLSSFSFPLSRLGADTGGKDRNHSWFLAVLTLLLQLRVVTSCHRGVFDIHRERVARPSIIAQRHRGFTGNSAA